MKDYNEQVDKIVDIIQNINLSKITLMVGSNSSGKSLIASQLSYRCRKLGMSNIHVGMSVRSGSNPSMGALSSMANDLPWLATGYQTLYSIKSCSEIVTDNYFIIDELELGCGEELQVSLAHYVNEFIKTNKPYGVLIITHSRIVATLIEYDNFVSTCNYKDLNEWLNRNIIPVDLNELEENKLFYTIKDRLKGK